MKGEATKMQAAQETTDALASARKLRHEIDATAQRTLAAPVPPQTLDALGDACYPAARGSRTRRDPTQEIPQSRLVRARTRETARRADP